MSAKWGNVSDFVLCFRAVHIPHAAGSASPNAVAFTSSLRQCFLQHSLHQLYITFVTVLAGLLEGLPTCSISNLW